MTGAASCRSRNVFSVAAALAGLTSTATRAAVGTNSCRSRSRLAATSSERKLTPVALPPRTGKAGHKTKLDRVARDTEYDWDRRSCRFGRARRRPAAGDSDHRHWAANHIGQQCRQPIVLALQPVVLDSDVLPFDVTGFLETFTERGHITRSDFRSPRVQKLDHRHRRLLPPRAPYLDREQQAAATDQCDELTPLHVRHGDFLPYALSASPTGQCARFSGTISLPQRGRLVLGADLKCSESRR